MKYRKQSYFSLNQRNKAWNQLPYNTKMKYASYFISVEIMFIKESIKECIKA